jgi:DNA-binding PadR family transcriptional regulator
MVMAMSVPLTLLGLLEREPSHGYDLKRDYDTYFGRGRPLSFGQVYATLGRLARDGKVAAAQIEPGDGPDRKRYVITEAGVTEFETWLAEPVEAEPHLQTVLFAKVVLALMLGRPAEQYLDTQRGAHLQRMRELTEIKQSGELVDGLLADHGLFHLEADLRWIDMTAARLGALAQVVRPAAAEAIPGSSDDRTW